MKCPRCKGSGEVEEKAPSLSARQVEILALMAKGYDHPAVARKLFLGLNTVYTHINRARRALDVSSTREAIEELRSWGVI